MIVIRHLDNTNSECDQEIYCDIACFGTVRFGDWTTNIKTATLKIESVYDALNKIAESDQFNVYEDEHIIPNSHYPTIEDFLSEDSQEYCYSCKEELN
tara:strand:+ start:191 stop:484 length:294 start_codon:yes stop_codon:yes gene_type:complete